MAINKGLGKGFDALLPQNFDNSILSDSGEQVKQLAIDVLVPNPQQPRRTFDDDAIAGLAESIIAHGIVQPLVVTPNGSEYYIIAGERRWRAARKANLKTVPAIVRTMEELQRLELALVENMQRVDLSPLEQAASILHLHQQFSQDYATIAKQLGKAQATVVNIVRLLQLPEAAREALHDKKISEGHARAILALKDEKLQHDLLDLILKNGWSVRQAERYVVAQKQGAKTASAAVKRVDTTTPQTERLANTIKAPVSLRRTAKGGRLEIAFKNETDLKRIIKLLSR